MKTKRGFNAANIEFLLDSPVVSDTEILPLLREVIKAFDDWMVKCGGPEWTPRTRLRMHERQLLTQFLLWIAHDAPSSE